MACFTLLHAHLEASRRRVHPTAMGLTPPSFFPRAIKVAPKKKCWAGWATFPCSTRFMKLVSACNRSLPPPHLQQLQSGVEDVGRQVRLQRRKGRSGWPCLPLLLTHEGCQLACDGCRGDVCVRMGRWMFVPEG